MSRARKKKGERNRNSLGFASSGSWAATERSEGEPGEPKRSGVAAQAGADSLLASRPDPEVVAKAKRRTYTAEYKLDILQEAEAAAATWGGIGALLRREGLYSSLLATWRRSFWFSSSIGWRLDFGPRLCAVSASRMPLARSRRQNARLAEDL